MSDGLGYAKVFSLENGGDDLGAADWKQVGLTITGEANGDRLGFRYPYRTMPKPLPLVPRTPMRRMVMMWAA